MRRAFVQRASEWAQRLWGALTPRRSDGDLEAELQAHLDLAEAADGRHGRVRVGGVASAMDGLRDQRGLPWLDSLLRDTRFGLRMLRKHAAVTGAVVASLALALGASVAAFSLVNALILRPLPVPHPEQLIYLSFPTYEPERPMSETFNDPTFVRLREAVRGQVALFAMSTQVMRPVAFGADSDMKEEVRAQFVSGDAFAQLGVTPAAGRLLMPDDDVRQGDHPVAVVSHAFWTRRFGGDPAAVGRAFTLQDRRYQIVGVAEPRFTGIEPGRPTDVWLPYAMGDPRSFGNYSYHWFRVIGRLTGVGRDQAPIALQAAFTNLRRDIAPGWGAGRPQASVDRFISTPLHVLSAAIGPSPLRRQFGRSLWMLTAIAIAVLLIAGSNVANLFLARAASREREMSLRLSIGAGRRRLIQQVLIECALVAGAACLLGLIFARIAAPAVIGMLTAADDPIQLDLGLDWRLLGFAGAATLLTTALFGLAPAIRASKTAPMTAAASRWHTRTGAMRPFMAMQVAFSLIVLFLGGLLVLSFTRLSRMDPGFASSNVLLLSIETLPRMDPASQRGALYDTLDRLRSIEGVEHASFAEFNLIGQAWTHSVPIPSRPGETVKVTMAPVAPDFFETMKIPLIDGRSFNASDMRPPDAAGVVIVNQSFVSRYFHGGTAVGRVVNARFSGESIDRHEVAGVVADTRHDLREPAAPMIYIPLTQRTGGAVVVRTTEPSAALEVRLRDAVRAAAPQFRVTSIRTQAAVIDASLLRERLLALLSAFFAIVGLVLAAVGIYGVLSHAVVQRTREIGIRLALGARQTTVVWNMLSDIRRSLLIGVIGGLAGGVYLARFLETLVFGVAPMEVWTLGLPLGTLAVAATAAVMRPAIRASRVNPVVALRCD